jgi:NitT/TauT family transport system ATP-binding protein
MTKLVEVHGIEKTYRTGDGRSLEALSSIDLDVEVGEFLSIIGPSGCGKSTLLHIIGGMKDASGGEVMVNGKKVRGPRPDDVAFVFQDYTLFPWRSVLSNVEVGLQVRGVAKEERREAARHNLELVGLGGFADSYPNELSGGMQQRVALARALTMEPKLLLMDEPFGALDEQTRTVLGEEVSRILERSDQSIIFVTHSLSEAVYLSDRVAVMSHRPGRIKKMLEVEEPRPRDSDFMTSRIFNDLRTELFELLHDEFREAAQAEMERTVQP